ncbi:MAG TPA: STM4013/SEN3800 family hydrolase [Candidatus Dormibacteraeota bacterium]|nr:STM4013/SEN3800 family hydrolase [Candidatus Dormibacteraeota bacterium]
MVNMNQIVGSHDILFMTLDTLRYDVAQRCWAEGLTPNFASILPPTGWERRHSPGSFTYAAHQAFFAGFLPTSVEPGLHPRLFALQFPGSETIADTTCVFDAPDIVSGLASRGYHTLCIGGVGFFNERTPLGTVLPGLFAESHWSVELGVTDPHSMENQVGLAEQIIHRIAQSHQPERLGFEERLANVSPARTEYSFDPVASGRAAVRDGPRSGEERLFLFLNVSAIHQPNRFYLPDAKSDSLESHAAALQYVDRQLPRLLEALGSRGPVFGIVCSDHGTAYGEDGYNGHRLAHPVVWDVPYAEFLLGNGHYEH